MITQRVDDGDARDGFLLLDGFPRNEHQADALGDALGAMGRRLTAVLLIEVSDEEVVRHLAGRRTWVKTLPSHIYHVDFDPPKHEDVCDQDGARLIQRDDDPRGDHPQAPGGLPRPHRAADRLLRPRRTTAPLRRQARRG